MTNEMIVARIRSGSSVTDNMQLMYENNLPLIKRFIKPYTTIEQTEDLLQEAYFGLWEAVQHYETSENVLFMTYAGYWIKQAIIRYIENCGSVVRIPGHTRQKIARYKKTVEGLSQEYGRIPTDKEIADSLCISISEIKNIKSYMQEVASLDSPFAEDESLTLSDTLQADFNLENNVIEEVYTEQSKADLWGIVDDYTSKEQAEVLRKRYIENKTYREIAIENNVSLDRGRQIEQAGLRKLRMGKAKRKLLEKLEVAEVNMYRTGKANYDRHNFTSKVEYIAMRRTEIQEEYERRLKECLEYNEGQERACL